MSGLVKTWLKRLGTTFGLAAALASGWAGYLRLSGNFHPIEEGVIYRSGQLSGDQLASHIQEASIRTIINLRGNNSGRPWYDDEMKITTAAGVQHVGFPLSSGRELKAMGGELNDLALDGLSIDLHGLSLANVV